MTGELIPISGEQVKAVQEIVKAFRGLGAFIEKALGSTPENLVGYRFGDRLAIRRAENAMRMMEEARRRLEARGVEDVQRPSLSVALPIIEAAAEEDRDELVDLWARLLANAMDPKLGTVRYTFIEAVKAMDPMDARLVHHIHAVAVQSIRIGGGGDQIQASFDLISNQLNVRQDEVDISVRHLQTIGFLVKPDLGGQQSWFPTATLREFMRACYPERRG